MHKWERLELELADRTCREEQLAMLLIPYSGEAYRLRLC